MSSTIFLRKIHTIMAKFQGGLDEMIKALQLMSSNERKILLSELSKKDPQLTQLIESKLYNLENLRDITVKMLVEFLREIELTDLALALRLYDRDLQEYILSKVSKSMALDIRDILDGPKRRQSECEEALAKVLAIFRQMIDEQRLILSKDEKLV